MVSGGDQSYPDRCPPPGGLKSELIDKMSAIPESPSMLSESRASVSPSAQSGRVWMRLPKNRWRRMLFLGVYLVFCWGVVVVGIKAFWMLHAGVPLTRTPRNLDVYYGELHDSGLQTAHPRHDDDFFDVLLLDGSVLDPRCGKVEEYFTENLRADLGDRFRVFNLARQAHTSRDSLLKYLQLGDGRFELVIVYDGINDVRMNCCPRELFRDDYTHCSWYHEIQHLIDTGRMPDSAGIADELKLVHQLIHLTSSVDEKLVEYGHEIKTDRTLRRNHEEIIRAAMERRDVVLLSTYAYDIPDDYTPERFANRALDYGDWKRGARIPAEMWGRPKDVTATLDAQNAEIRALAKEHPEVLFTDQRELMPGQQGLFYDVCHLADSGSRRFVDNLWPVVSQRIAEWRAAHPVQAPGKK